MRRYIHPIGFIVLFLCMSLIGHAYILYRFFADGLLYTGPNDGMEQMVPIQMFLYEKWSEGTFFYATDFGLGGDFFTDLSYYFSTNFIFILTTSVTCLLALLHIVDPKDMMYWFTQAWVVSILKCTGAMIATYYYARQLKLQHVASVVFAVLFAMSPLYFRFTVYWPFFSDVFILLPLLLLSIERFLKSGKLGLFIIITAISFANNFYFAYYQVLMGLIYYSLRVFHPHPDDQKRGIKTVLPLVVAAVLGVGSSLFFFFHGARSFFNNQRIPFDGDMPLIEQFNENTNLFYDNYLIIISFVVIQALLTFKLYRHFYFRLFAILSILTIIAAFIPYVDSIFNGFSAPQNRWHYLLAFVTSGLIATYIQHFKSLSRLTYILTAIPAMAIVFMSASMNDRVVWWIYLIPIVFLIGLLVLTIEHHDNKRCHFVTVSFACALIVLQFAMSAVFIKNQIFHTDHEKRANTFYAHASLYNTPLQQSLVDQMNADKREDERIDWRVNEQDNTPMYQHFKGMSLYSSIFDQQLIEFYYRYLMINLKEESVSRYQSTGSRSNIASLLSVRYLMEKDYQHQQPAHFEKVHQFGQYVMYENQYPLPAVRVSHHYYNAEDLTTPIDREHAMLDGVVLDHQGQTYPQKAQNLVHEVEMTTLDAQRTRSDGLTVTKPNGGVTLQLPETLREQYEDFYLVVYFKRNAPDSNSTLDVNGYENHRLFNNSKYRTGQNTLLYRVQPDNNGQIHLGISPTGSYQLRIQGLYGEDYDTLKQAYHQQAPHHYEEHQGKIKVHLAEHSGGMAVINIPYRKGMTAIVDGHAVIPQKVNGMMTGIKIGPHAKQIDIHYRPPYFITMIVLSIISIISSIIYSRWYQHKQSRKSEKH
ncbi:YfhO family protein [Staphylococcus ursi]|uniref:YfhO family protein n=1 Tax=Staphylococcus sp. MI 10-1553 TaxID=1912064 RepID=UPI00139854E8|nr:YfhO family protein [Staphylococcus sp. MI 10-1553]QHW37398.1 YfhO family protein [Staphylococcus sp. MI 10-1553]